MLNGSYSIRLSSTENGLTTIYTIALVVSRNLKIGNFSVSFNDLSIPVQGIPLTVVRTYDTRNSGRKGDFGYGWNLDVKSVRLEKSGNLGTNWVETVDEVGQLFQYNLIPSRPKFVTITFSDGKVFKFKAQPNPSQQLATIRSLNSLNFVAEPGTLGTLIHMEQADLSVQGDIPQVPPGAGDVNIINLIGLRLGEPFNPTKFKFTTQEGTEFIIDEKLGLLSAKDLNGNELVIDSTGITSRNGSTIRAQVAFTRDSQNRITRVTDPMGNFAQYGYDSNGDLVSFTDQENNTTTFNYLAGHKLLKITDPRGITPITNTYDNDGRLISHTDSFGKTITYTHNLGTRQEIITDRLGHPTTFGYDERGNVVTKVDALNNANTYTYDALDNQLTETNALGNTSSTTYDASNNKLTQTDALGNITSYTYNNRNQVLTITDARGAVTANIYDTNGHLTSSKDALNHTTTYTYTSSGTPLTTTDALNNTTSFAYNAAGDLASTTDALGHISSYTYDANHNQLTQTVTRTVNGTPENITTTNVYDTLNRVTSTTYADGSTTSTLYNAIGKAASTTDQAGRTTSFTYDNQGQLLSTTLADGSTTSATYDAEGKRLTSVDQLGHITSFQYDTVGRLIKTIAPDNSFTTTTYDAIGRVASTTDALNHTTNYEYDPNCGCSGRQSKITDALGNITTKTYDQNANLNSVTDALGHTTSYTYDALNRQIKVTFADNTFTSNTYDQLGRRTASTDQAGKTTQFDYDVLGRLNKVKDALNQITQYSYNELGQQLTQIDALGRTTSYEYDQLGRRTKRTLPLGQFETYTYNQAGNLVSRKDFNNKVTTFAYDTLNRLTSKTPDASFSQAPITFTYNILGQRTTMVDASGTTTYSYDDRNRLTSKQTPVGTLTYNYNSVGNILTLRSSNTEGVSVDYQYDPLNRLSAIVDNRLGTTANVTNYGFDAVGNLASITLPNNVQTIYNYNNLNRLTDMNVKQGTTNLASYQYSLGAAGNRLSVTELGGRTINYQYDNLYRLTQETISGAITQNGTVTYSYDVVGNRLSRTSTVPAIPTQQNITVDINDRLASDSYDNNGSTVVADGRMYTYDFENRIIGVSGNGINITIIYDDDGNRVSKTVNGITTSYLVDTNNLTGYAQVVEEFQNNQVVRQYTYGVNLISQRQLIGSNRVTSFYQYDGYGSIRGLTDTNGSLTDTFSYDAFGLLIEQTGNIPNYYLFAGEQFDPDLGLYYSRARYLNVGTGRFWSMDNYQGNNYDPSSLHKYLYANQNPVNKVDPSGKSAIEILGAVALGLTLATITTLTAATLVTGFTLATTYFSILVQDYFPASEALKLPQDTISDLQAYFPTIDLANEVHIFDHIPNREPINTIFKQAIIKPSAITLDRSIYFDGTYQPLLFVNNNEHIGIGLIAHELTHVQQYNERGLYRFAVSYFTASLLIRVLTDGNPYQDIYLEYEARQNAERILKDLASNPNRKVK